MITWINDYVTFFMLFLVMFGRCMGSLSTFCFSVIFVIVIVQRVHFVNTVNESSTNHLLLTECAGSC